MSARHFIWVRTPADTDRCFGAYFTISSFGVDPHGYGENFDPGCGPEIEIVAVLDDAEKVISVSDEDRSAIRDFVIDRFDFAAAARDNRDAGLTLMEGVL